MARGHGAVQQWLLDEGLPTKGKGRTVNELTAGYFGAWYSWHDTTSIRRALRRLRDEGLARSYRETGKQGQPARWLRED